GTPGVNDMPGRIQFSTTPDGSSTPLERLRITNSGNIGIGTTSPYATLSVDGDLALSGGIYDNTASLGSAGMVLQTTGTGVQWVATSSLGIGGSIAADSLDFTDFADNMTVDAATIIDASSADFVIDGVGSYSGNYLAFSAGNTDIVGANWSLIDGAGLDIYDGQLSVE